MSESESGRPNTGSSASVVSDGSPHLNDAAGEERDVPLEAVPDASSGPSVKPRIGDTRPAPATVNTVVKVPPSRSGVPDGGSPGAKSRSRPRSKSRSNSSDSSDRPSPEVVTKEVVTKEVVNKGVDGDPRSPKRARGRGARSKKAKSVGRYLVCVHVEPQATQISMIEGRALVEHYVARSADETTQIDGNIYCGRVQNVLAGMEAAFVDIGIPKNAVLYRGDVRYDREDIEGGAPSDSAEPRIEDVLKPGQAILCQVTKNPIGAKGARLTQEVSLPGRFAVLVPNSSTFGISKRLGDNERRRLRKIVDDVRPPGHGLIVRTAAEGVTPDELRRDVDSLLEQWVKIDEAFKGSTVSRLLYSEPPLAVRILREELNSDYRAVIIDDLDLFEQVRSYVEAVSPDLAERVEYYDTTVEPLPIYERYHVHEQLHKALDRKVWLPSGGSLIIERTEALTVIDVNTGKNVGKTNLEETVYRNNLEAAVEVARQLRLRDIGGIIVIDFIDMEIRGNRDKVSSALRSALARDKTRTQVLDISELGLVEMTRKRVSEGLIESLSTVCEMCNGRGIVLDRSLC